MAVAASPPVEPQEPQKEPLQLPLFEGNRVTDYRINFGGNVALADLDVIEAIGKAFKGRAGEELELVVEVSPVTMSGKKVKDGAGNQSGLVKSTVLIVSSVRLAAGGDGDE